MSERSHCTVRPPVVRSMVIVYRLFISWCTVNSYGTSPFTICSISLIHTNYNNISP